MDISTYARFSGKFKEIAPAECIAALSSMTRYLRFFRPFARLVLCQSQGATVFDRLALRKLRSL